MMIRTEIIITKDEIDELLISHLLEVHNLEVSEIEARYFQSDFNGFKVLLKEENPELGSSESKEEKEKEKKMI